MLYYVSIWKVISRGPFYGYLKMHSFLALLGKIQRRQLLPVNGTRMKCNRIFGTLLQHFIISAKKNYFKEIKNTEKDTLHVSCENNEGVFESQRLKYAA